MTDNKKQKVQISLYATKLKNVAGLGKGTSDPYAVVTLLAGGVAEKPQVLGKTEVLKNNLNPAWTTSFTTDYSFGEETRISISIFDEVRKTGKPLSMGAAVFEIGECLAARGSIKAKKLRKGGTLFCRITRAAEVNHGTLNLHLRGIKLKNVDGLFSKSDPFFVISSQVNSAGGMTWQPVYRSEVIQNNLYPTWRPCSVAVESLCDGDKTRPVLVEVYDWEKSGKHQPMGSFQTNVDGLLRSRVSDPGPKPKVAPPGSFELIRRGKRFGDIIVTQADITGASNMNRSQPVATSDFSNALGGPPPESAPVNRSSVPPLPPPMAPPVFSSTNKPRFVDYLAGGTEINLAVAIDFTGSNGDPRRPGTLHYIHPDGSLNDYEKAITAVGSIVARYDSDQKFPVLGFGAKYGGQIQHCFQVGKSAELDGVSGILEGYRATFKSGLVMSGPTVFAEVINYAASTARSQQDEQQRHGKQSYTILLILTDGAVTEIEQTKQAIRYASTAPLSIVIIGIGDADFSKMQFLDDFQQEERQQTRDIVQFVEFGRHQHNRRNLTKETLDEIPDQLVGYFYGNSIMPLPPVTGSKLNIYEEDVNEEDEIDLSMDINEEGEIYLTDESQAHYDGEGYGNIQTFMPPPMAPPATAPMASAPQTVPVVVPTVFHIQAPANSYPGMQIQVQNPTTGQFQIVTIPQGVQPGSTFAVGF